MFQVYRQGEIRPRVKEAKNGTVVAVGNFDGVHVGHQKVLKAAQDEAKKRKLPLAVVTFEPHPKVVLRPDEPLQRITPFADKARLLKENGADMVYVVKFSKAYAQNHPEVFINDTLKTALNAHCVVVGQDFRFGHKRAGGVDTLHGNGFDVAAVELAKNEEEEYSSSLIRAHIAAGEMEQAQALLGRPQTMRLKFTEDDHLNLVAPIGRYIRPKDGLYFAQLGYNETFVDDGTGEEVAQPTETVVSIKGWQMFIPPTEKRPDTPKKPIDVHMMQKIDLKQMLAG